MKKSWMGGYVHVLYRIIFGICAILLPLSSFAQTADFETLKARASQGDVRAIYELARDYDEGRNGAPKDPKAAFYWINQGVKMRAPWAFYVLGAAYEQGAGTEKDLSLARYWYEQAIAAGFSQATPALNALKARSVDGEPQYSTARVDRPTAMKERDGKIYLSLDSTERIEPPSGARFDYPRCKLTFSILNNSNKRLAEILLVALDVHGNRVSRADCKTGECNLYVEDLASGFARTQTAYASVCTDGDQPIVLNNILALRFDGGTEFSYAKEVERAGGSSDRADEKGHSLMKESLVVKSRIQYPAIALNDYSSQQKASGNAAQAAQANTALSLAKGANVPHSVELGRIASDMGAEKILACQYFASTSYLAQAFNPTNPTIMERAHIFVLLYGFLQDNLDQDIPKPSIEVVKKKVNEMSTEGKTALANQCYSGPGATLALRDPGMLQAIKRELGK